MRSIIRIGNYFQLICSGIVPSLQLVIGGGELAAGIACRGDRLSGASREHPLDCSVARSKESGERILRAPRPQGVRTFAQRTSVETARKSIQLFDCRSPSALRRVLFHLLHAARASFYNKMKQKWTFHGTVPIRMRLFLVRLPSAFRNGRRQEALSGTRSLA
jgi:hypothetical protein